MEILPDRWVKPFSTGLSCINTIHGECIRGVSAKECAKICNDSKRCNFGYHIKVPNEESSYCLPLDGFPRWGDPKIFDKSTFPSQSSPIFHPELGVDITAFHNPESKELNEENISTITQLGIYLLRFRQDSSKPENDLFLMKDLTFGKDPNNAIQIVIFRDLPVASSISTAGGKIRNGELVFLKNSKNNNVFIFQNPEKFGFFPYTVRWSSSILFNLEDLYHTQLITKYPFYHNPIMQQEMFAIRCARAPVKDFVYYWDMDSQTKKLVPRKVSKEELSDYSHLDKFLNFTLETRDQIDPNDAQNFRNSQLQYLLDNFYFSYRDGGASTSRGNAWRLFLVTVCIVAACLFLFFILFVLKRT